MWILVRTRKVDVVETLHGVAVADPYRWLEDGDSPEVRAWDEAQTAETRRLARARPRAGRAARARDGAALGRVTSARPPSRAAATGPRRYFHMRREGAQEQAALYVRDGVDGADRVLIDPAPLSADGTTALDWWNPSREGARVAWGLSEAGSEESTLRSATWPRAAICPTPSLTRATPRSPGCRAARPSIYTRYPAPGDVPAGDEKYSCRVYRHTVGDDWTSDPLVFGEGRDKLDVPAVFVSPGGRWLVVRVHMGWQKSEIWLRDLHVEGSPWVAIATGEEALYEPDGARRRALPRDERSRASLSPRPRRLRVARACATGARCSPSTTTCWWTWP